MQKNAAFSTTKPIGQGSEPQFSPGENAETGLSAALKAANAGNRPPNTDVIQSSAPVFGGSEFLQVLCAPQESEPGHTEKVRGSGTHRKAHRGIPVIP